MSSIISQIRPFSPSLYYYMAGNPFSEYSAIYDAPWPSGRATGIIDYSENITFVYEHQFGCFPSYNANTGTAVTNPFVLSAIPGAKMQGPILVDNYPGGITGYIENVVNPGFISGINLYFPGTTGATFNGAICLDYETWGPYFYSLPTGGVSQMWRDHYVAKYGDVGALTEEEVEAVYRNSYLAIYSGIMIRHVELLKQHVPNVSNVFIFNVPALQVNQFDNPTAYGFANTGLLTSFNDQLAPLYRAVDSLNPEMYMNVAKTIRDEEMPANNRQLRYTRYFTLLRKPADETLRISNLYNKPIFGGLFAVYNAGATTYAGQPINDLDMELMMNIGTRMGVSGYYSWLATPTAMAFSSLSAVQSGMVAINKAILKHKNKYSGLNFPDGYSELWDSPQMGAGV